MPDGKDGIRSHGDKQYADAFKELVKKEPEYNSERPFRGIAKLGTQEFAFALDMSTPPPAPKDETPENGSADAEAEPKDDSAIAKLKGKVAEKTAPAPMPLFAYDRLYFDINHNGDLTDDKAMEASVKTHPHPDRGAYAQISFPRLEVTIDADGTAIDSVFFLSGHAHSSINYSNVGMRLNAGAYREGEITLEGKKRKIVLIDFNSNGRFDDAIKVITIHRRPNDKGEFHPQYGDTLLIDPSPSKIGRDSPYDVTSSDYRYNVSKLINIDGRFYGMKITPAGDKLTLEPSSVALGNVTNPNDGFRALIHSDSGVLKISGDKDVPIPVPEGEWRLLSYTITLPETPKPSEPAKEKEKKKAEKETSAIKMLEEAIKAFINKPPVRSPSRPRWSMVSARATAECKPVKVVEGKTVELPFGPPYKPLVTAQNYGNQEQVSLQMSLVGVAGEICSNLMAHGGRPPKPDFTITDPKGEVVQQGSFEYG